MLDQLKNTSTMLLIEKHLFSKYISRWQHLADFVRIQKLNSIIAWTGEYQKQLELYTILKVRGKKP